MNLVLLSAILPVASSSQTRDGHTPRATTEVTRTPSPAITLREISPTGTLVSPGMPNARPPPSPPESDTLDPTSVSDVPVPPTGGGAEPPSDGGVPLAPGGGKVQKPRRLLTSGPENHSSSFLRSHSSDVLRGVSVAVLVLGAVMFLKHLALWSRLRAHRLGHPVRPAPIDSRHFLDAWDNVTSLPHVLCIRETIALMIVWLSAVVTSGR
ncbi:hypothetical protein CC1G_05675 [Coprinopsis cinerea okayama7|uniref:Uncharacterized protein n=1 Tax=Coprinopsis cinerea (strain Okayama-7 / 130 / ATCC MYA-4618 / FGSC 9003) TaxID=240176 RepID=A8N9U8_COPC7|nr:hypothetical protein CC1G_05675 [Coprinopsis cinerea okayama7\|eukprot:XP_001831604.1 hypothetical protein CC1G_05675 [Coprinopsis cinerea okayama7\